MWEKRTSLRFWKTDARARDFYLALPRPNVARQDRPRSGRHRFVCRPARAGGAGRAGKVGEGAALFAGEM